MKAVVVRPDDENIELAIGQEIEVLGFVRAGYGQLRAVWRDDEGSVWEIDVELIRMLPRVEPS